MAYIDWWNRTGPVTLGERFGLDEISIARNTLSPTKSYTAKAPGNIPLMAPELPEDLTPMPNIPDLLREEGIQVGEQVKDGGRIGFSGGNLVKQGPHKGLYYFRFGSQQGNNYATYYAKSPEEGEAWIKRKHQEFPLHRPKTSIAFKGETTLSDIKKRVLELLKEEKLSRSDLTAKLKKEGYIKPSNPGSSAYVAAANYLGDIYNSLAKEHNLKIPKKLEKYDDVFAEIHRNNPELNANEIVRVANEQGGKDLNWHQVDSWAKRNNITLITADEQMLPEIKALDKVIKKNKSKFESMTRYGKISEGHLSAKGLMRTIHRELAEIKINGKPVRIPGDQLKSRLVKLFQIYSEDRNVSETYKIIKPIRDFKDSKFAKSFLATIDSAGFLGVVEKAKLLDLPKNDIALLEDITKGASKLSKVRMAGDHTDSDALMRAVLNDKNWKQYKKDFLRINMISNTLNRVKKNFDRTISSAYNRYKKGMTSAEEFNKIVQDTKEALLKKTKIPIGNPQIVNGEFQFNFLTERIGDLEQPRNKGILSAMNNLVKQSGVKFQGIDQELKFANTIEERLNILKNAGVDQLKNSKYIKAFAAMSGDLGKAANLILKTKPGKIGAVVGMSALLSSIASASEKDETLEPRDKKQEAGAIFPYDIVSAIAEDPKKAATIGGATALGTFGPKKVLGSILKAAEKAISPILPPLTSVVARGPHKPDVTSGLEWLTPTFWNAIVKKFGLTGTIEAFKKATTVAAKEKIAIELLLRAGIPVSALPAISGGAAVISAPLLYADAAKALQKRIDKKGLTGLIAKGYPDPMSAGADVFMEDVIKEKKRRDAEGMDYATGGIASLMK